MHRIRLLAAALSCCLLTADGLAERYRAPLFARARRPRPQHTFPFEATSDKPFITVTINGSAPLSFVLDSGAGVGCCLDRGRASQLGFAPEPGILRQWGAGGQGRSVRVSRIPGAALDIHGWTFKPRMLTVLELDQVAPYEGRAIDGLIGADFFAAHVVQIDYAEQRVRVFAPETYTPDASERFIALSTKSGFAVAHGTVRMRGRPALEGEFIFDTGYRGTIALHRPFVEKHGLLDMVGDLAVETIGGGLGGESRGRVGRVGSVQFGPVTIAEPVAVFSADNIGVMAHPRFAGIVGAKLLNRFRVTLDYRHSRLVFSEARDPTGLHNDDASGLFLVAEGPAFKRFRIKSVRAGSPAADIDLRRDDIIREIDGRPTSELTLDGIRRLLCIAGRTHTLVIRRGMVDYPKRLTTREHLWR